MADVCGDNSVSYVVVSIQILIYFDSTDYYMLLSYIFQLSKTVQKVLDSQYLRAWCDLAVGADWIIHYCMSSALNMFDQDHGYSLLPCK